MDCVEQAEIEKPWVAITQGDPAGIGPELCLRVMHDPSVRDVCRPVLIGDDQVMRQAAAMLKLPPPQMTLTVDALLEGDGLGAMEAPVLVDCQMITAEVTPGRATRRNGEASLRYIEVAIAAARAGRVRAVTTAPITKATLHMAGIDEPGHTEIFAHRTGTTNYAMMLYSPRLAVSFVTCHQSLESVPGALTIDAICRVTDLTGRTLRRLRGAEPRLAVLGLNPHAGEEGLFGRQELEIIAPAVERSRAEGWQVEGPVPPDAAFMPQALERYDGHVTMYHDQGSIPFKMVSLHDGVNITMGLPIVRTSPDHGTAYDIAWQGKADPASMRAALRLAAGLA